MRSRPGLGAANTALISLYFAPVWGSAAFRALASPHFGFEDPVQAAAASYYRTLLDLGLDGLLRFSIVLASVKLLVAAACVACVIDLARAVLVGRREDRATFNTALILAGTAVVLFALPALGTAGAGLIRLHATELLLLAAAIAVIAVERHVEDTRTPRRSEEVASGRSNSRDLVTSHPS